MITIFTPTYNRLSTLKILARSLENQTLKTFEWILVDDGSNDGTEQWIQDYLNQSKLNIRYYRQKNQGKHIAFNKAIEECKGELFFCVDSDDLLTNYAIEEIQKDNLKVQKDCKLIGMVYPRVASNEPVSKSWSYINNKCMDIIDYKEVYKIVETAIIIKTEILKKYKFNQYKKNGTYETFCPEGFLYNQLIPDGQFVSINKKIYLTSEYREDGLSRKVFKLWIDNYQGIIESLCIKYYACKKYSLSQRIRSQVKCILNINGLCWKVGLNVFRYTPGKILTLILFLPGIFFIHKVSQYISGNW